MKGSVQSARLVGVAVFLLLCLISYNARSRKPAAATTAHSATLSWKASTSQVKGYNIYRAMHAGGPYTRINAAVHPGTTYVDSHVTAGATYYYVTTAVGNSGVESSYSNEVVAVIPQGKH